MSKLDKNIQDAKVWRKKHETEVETLAHLDKALANWESRVAVVEKTKAQWQAAKEAAIEARKTVTAVLKKTKQDRKAKVVTPTVPEAPQPSVAKKVAPKKAAPQKPATKVNPAKE